MRSSGLIYILLSLLAVVLGCGTNGSGGRGQDVGETVGSKDAGVEESSKSKGTPTASGETDSVGEERLGDSSSQEATLTIGSPAPALDIEHWLQDGKGRYKPVTTFQPDQIYIVEFWATWCDPCLSSMPHLAELQVKYAQQGVRLISVSDEPAERVEAFLDGSTSGEDADAQTYRELTSVYSLTTDPDGSTHADYKDAAKQDWIPVAFLVGKSGRIEWIGHPMEMEGPLQAVIKGSWDRDAFRETMQMQQRIKRAIQLASQGKFNESLKVIDSLLGKTDHLETQVELKFYKLQLLLALGDRTDEFAALLPEAFEQLGEIPEIISQQVPPLAARLQSFASDDSFPKKVLDDSILLIEKALKSVAAPQRWRVLNSLAHLHQVAGDYDAAIATQTEAVESLTNGRVKQRLQGFLDELRKAKTEQNESRSDSTNAK